MFGQNLLWSLLSGGPIKNTSITTSQLDFVVVEVDMRDYILILTAFKFLSHTTEKPVPLVVQSHTVCSAVGLVTYPAGKSPLVHSWRVER